MCGPDGLEGLDGPAFLPENTSGTVAVLHNVTRTPPMQLRVRGGVRFTKNWIGVS